MGTAKSTSKVNRQVARMESNKEKFLKALKDFKNYGQISNAAREIGVTWQTVWNWRQKDGQFDADVEAALLDMKQQVHAALKRSAIRDALDGKELTRIFLMKNMMPEEFGDRKTIEVKGQRELIKVIPAFVEEAQVVDEGTGS